MPQSRRRPGARKYDPARFERKLDRHEAAVSGGGAQMPSPGSYRYGPNVARPDARVSTGHYEMPKMVKTGRLGRKGKIGLAAGGATGLVAVGIGAKRHHDAMSKSYVDPITGDNFTKAMALPIKGARSVKAIMPTGSNANKLVTVHGHGKDIYDTHVVHKADDDAYPGRQYDKKGRYGLLGNLAGTGVALGGGLKAANGILAGNKRKALVGAGMYAGGLGGAIASGQYAHSHSRQALFHDSGKVTPFGKPGKRFDPSTAKPR